MTQSNFKALVLSSEINLGKIARHFGMNQKFKWEDLLLLDEQSLKGLLREPDGKMVYIFHFGAMVFVNFEHHQMMDVISYIKQIEKSVNVTNPFEFSDDYRLEITLDEDPAINNDTMITAESHEGQGEIIATVLAKSVALEKIEADIDILLDDIEEVVQFLEQGKLNVSDDKLAKMSAKILGYKFNTISYIRLLDKPDITWVNESASQLFVELSTLFELDDRYKNIRHKSETLMDITEVFSGLTHARRGNRLEWAVIILIAIEILLSLYTMFFQK
ncbi:putative Rmd1/YagE family protein [Sporomusaceae bacterium BoRhaA]|uniref:RMD1 family protein n=1 Tax=Pelorhabdus rhamnosifermentans TaxID=2772457 RepID=UPI001C05F5CB|nr:RMD1 family protein [Pelorhabdus rhamnosifermentans]MBU2702932.1 putative Rmd1/YagE family protein [Pelorhabdus rhamnosifermentans]